MQTGTVDSDKEIFRIDRKLHHMMCIFAALLIFIV